MTGYTNPQPAGRFARLALTPLPARPDPRPCLKTASRPSFFLRLLCLRPTFHAPGVRLFNPLLAAIIKSLPSQQPECVVCDLPPLFVVFIEGEEGEKEDAAAAAPALGRGIPFSSRTKRIHVFGQPNAQGQ